MLVWVILADQIDSRRHDDEVPHLLHALTSPALLVSPTGHSVGTPEWALPPERTSGDEIQALTTDPASLIHAMWTVGSGQWRIGVSRGNVNTPLPDSTRAARGPAYILAREAIEECRRRRAAIHVCPNNTNKMRRFSQVSQVVVDLARGMRPAARDVAMSYDLSMSSDETARSLGISTSAVSQRLTRARWEYLVETRQLAVDLAQDAQ
ncbi:hypothetical protein FYJ43_01500 [Cutibacterium sp. WCA-380-WT-3A]|uniref:RNA polymerase sigma factor 70 region 4 type 2 domain-containing protein n=1 Tax=Cutibacterium porci TaxID=2605781 RepID=A0A7K0J498_9ACTN|nr:sigma factor-like helix-turn-helix DNA-binding protein [Cutibacterium porci]MSS44755.1 hypothetical protein [Cutibacterium porci]